MAVAPPAAWGMVSTLPPRRNGGNLDNKELVAGTTLYLPIHVDGALFSVGDGHGVQGDGEVCVTAIETGLIGTFELIVRDDMHLEWPRAETPTHMMTMAFDPDLDDCVVIALRHMVDLVARRPGITREQAYTLCSLAADLRVTQVVNGTKGIHVMLEKRTWRVRLEPPCLPRRRANLADSRRDLACTNSAVFFSRSAEEDREEQPPFGRAAATEFGIRTCRRSARPEGRRVRARHRSSLPPSGRPMRTRC